MLKFSANEQGSNSNSMSLATTESQEKSSSEAEKSLLRREGFIDEELVQKLVISHAEHRERMSREKMEILQAEADYAGWNLVTNHSSDRAA